MTEEKGIASHPVDDDHKSLVDEPGEGTEEAEMHAVFADLTAKRVEVLGETHTRMAFPIRLLGGAWTSRHRGVPYDAFSAAASSAEVSRFCLAYRLPKPARFGISAYGESGVSLMCHAWPKRMCHIWALAQSSGPGYEFQPEDMLVDLGGEFEAFAASLDGRAKSRAQQIRDLAPTNP